MPRKTKITLKVPKSSSFGTTVKRAKKVSKSASKASKSPPKVPKRGRGRPIGTGTLTREEVLSRQREASERYRREVGRIGRDIAPIDWETIDWDRRLACKFNLQLFCETYLESIFYLGWSQDQLKCVSKTQQVFLTGGMFALAMPRGGGKTAICRAGMVWGTAYGHRRFPFFIGSTQPKAVQTLDAIKTIWYRNTLLRQDFPEIAWSIYKLENRFHLARGQMYNGEPTCVEWGSESIRFPCVVLEEEAVKIYQDHDPGCLIHVKSMDRWIPKTGGLTISTAGIDGSIRGEAEIHPLTLEQPRPDIVLLDDVQKDQKADSPTLCEKLIRLIDGAVAGLSGPGQHIAVLFPCTVIREGDAADTYLDTIKKPEYRGERCSMVIKWPKGITDTEITLSTPAGKHWNRYDELRRSSLRKHGDMRDATEYYGKHRKAMDNGFIVSWEERYTKEDDQGETELSAQQHAMNLRMKAPETFTSEFQNKGRRLDATGEMLITSGQLAEKVLTIGRGELPADVQHVAAAIDVQNEGLFWVVAACAPDYTGLIVDYGVWPDIKTRYFSKGQMEGWSYLTTAFFKRYPEQRDKAIRTESGRIRAPLEAKIFHALSQCVPWLLSREFVRQDQFQTVLRIQKLAIDTRWGQTSDIVKRYIRDCGYRIVVPYYGQAFPPTNKQLEEYELRKGWYFEHIAHPQVKDPKWVVRPNPDGMFYLCGDIWRLKDFLFARFGSPPGSPGSFSLFSAPPDQHEMYADHICNSEYPEPVTARGYTKNFWKERESGFDNDYLDCTAACMALLSLLGAYLQTGNQVEVERVKITDRWRRAT